MKKIQLPFTKEIIESLNVGDQLELSGEFYTARDAAHKRLIEAQSNGTKLPIELKGATIYYTGPSATPPGAVIGSAGPTTAYRMDPYSVDMLRMGVMAMIGKGERGAEVSQALQDYKAIFCAAIGGAGAYLSQKIIEAEVVAYHDLGPEAIHRMVVKDFPVIVAQDIYGGNIYRRTK